MPVAFIKFPPFTVIVRQYRKEYAPIIRYVVFCLYRAHIVAGGRGRRGADVRRGARENIDKKMDKKIKKSFSKWDKKS
jgi:hypothetical protein